MSRPSAEQRAERGRFWLDRRAAGANWQIVRYDADAGRCRYESTGTANRADAEIRLAERILGRRLDKGGADKADAQGDQAPLAGPFAWPRIDDVFDCYLAEIAGTAGEGQARLYKAHFMRCFGATATIDTLYAVEGQQDYYDFRVDERDVAAGTVARELHIFRSAIHTYHELRAALPSLPRIARVAGAGRARERWLLPEEVAAILAAAWFPHIRLFIMLALETAARAGALVDAMWRQTDFAGRAINLSVGGPSEGAVKRRVRVPIVTPGLLAELEYAHSVRRTDYVVEYGGFAVGCVRKAFAGAVARARLKNPVTGEMEPLRNPQEITPNTLRHTAATWMAKRGVPLREIADFLGHTTTRMVEKHYAHHHPDWRQRGKAALAAEIGAIKKVEAPELLVRRHRALLRAAASDAAETPQKHRSQKKGAGGRAANPLKNLVEPVGIEPTTSTMPL